MKTFKQLHPVVNILLLGTVMSRGAAFMALPFLAIYMTRTTDLSPVMIGLAIGVGPLTSTIGSFIGGSLSDIFGRKGIMLSALFLYSIVFLGFAMADQAYVFILFSALNGLCRSFFEPTSQALMADLTKKDMRLKVFSLRYTAINIGASVGPLLGAYLGAISANQAFFVTSAIYFIYFVLLFILLTRISVKPDETKPQQRITFLSAISIVRKDVALGWFLVAGILINIGYAQIESSLPQYLKSSLGNGVVLYSVLLSMNAILVVCLQMALTKVMEKIPLLRALQLGTCLFALGYLGLAFSDSWVSFILSMIVVTVGEIFIFPLGSVVIDRLAPDHMRGTYFGANGLRSIGFFIGPWLGGYLLTHFNGRILFVVTTIIVAAGIIFYTLGYRRMIERDQPPEKQQQTLVS